jgi:2-aminoadipate transaminase
METQFSSRIKNLRRSVVRDILSFHSSNDMISFAGGLPGKEALPVEAMRKAADRVFEREGIRALQYGTTEGYNPLREWIADYLCSEGIPTGPDNILITGGSQQALDLIGRLFLNPGDQVAVTLPTYNGAIQSFELSEASLICTESDNDGPLPNEIRRAILQGAKFIYLTPTVANPSGRSISEKRRSEISEIIRTSGIPLIEDDPYSLLMFSDHSFRKMTSYMDGETILLGSFSKIVAPALRIGYIRAPENIISRMVPVKQAMDLHTSLVSQIILFEYLSHENLSKHISDAKASYRIKRDLILSELSAKLPQLKTDIPDGGVFLWGRWGSPINSSELLYLATEEGVAFVPGSSFYPDGGDNFIRINYSAPDLNRIPEGVDRLVKAYNRYHSLL